MEEILMARCQLYWYVKCKQMMGEKLNSLGSKVCEIVHNKSISQRIKYKKREHSYSRKSDQLDFLIIYFSSLISLQ